MKNSGRSKSLNNLYAIHGKLLLLALILGICATVLQLQITKAHGGVIMDSGFTSDYEWKILATPPLVEGAHLMSLVIHDIDTYKLINGMRVEVLIAHQSSKVACCNPDDHVGPIELEADPENWPGDYSYELPLDSFGNFEIKFIAYESDSEEPALEVISQFLVMPDLSKMTPEPNLTNEVTATVANQITRPVTTGKTTPVFLAKSEREEGDESDEVATNLEAAENNSTLATRLHTFRPTVEASNNARTTATVSQKPSETLLDKVRNRWMLWTASGLIPIVLLTFLILRPSMDELIAQKEAQLAAEVEEEATEEEALAN